MDGLRQILEREADAGFPGFPGARVAGTIPVTEDFVNAVLETAAPAMLKGIRLEFHEANRIVIRYGLLHASAVIGENVDLQGSPKLTLRLASGMIAWGLRKTVDKPFVQFDGTLVTVDLGEVIPLEEYGRFLALAKSVRLRTSPRQLAVDFEAASNGPAALL